MQHKYVFCPFTLSRINGLMQKCEAMFMILCTSMQEWKFFCSSDHRVRRKTWDVSCNDFIWPRQATMNMFYRREVKISGRPSILFLRWCFKDERETVALPKILSIFLRFPSVGCSPLFPSQRKPCLSNYNSTLWLKLKISHVRWFLHQNTSFWHKQSNKTNGLYCQYCERVFFLLRLNSLINDKQATRKTNNCSNKDIKLNITRNGQNT